MWILTPLRTTAGSPAIKDKGTDLIKHSGIDVFLQFTKERFTCWFGSALDARYGKRCELSAFWWLSHLHCQRDKLVERMRHICMHYLHMPTLLCNFVWKLESQLVAGVAHCDLSDLRSFKFSCPFSLYFVLLTCFTAASFLPQLYLIQFFFPNAKIHIIWVTYSTNNHSAVFQNVFVYR